MSKWVGLGAVVLIALIVSGAYWQGWRNRGITEELKDAKADQEQLDERREIQNAVNKLDDTGLRDTILGVPNGKGK